VSPIGFSKVNRISQSICHKQVLNRAISHNYPHAGQVAPINSVHED